ncbi:MAG: TldD/PmbA family protein [Symbiobacteriaceae bacterium]|nr:TldD/PmbA family protein [Symbiobacteriaceae bacterium]
MIKDLLATTPIPFPGKPTELRLQQTTTRQISLLSGNLVGNAKSVVGGVSARIFSKGVYGLASAAETDLETVNKVLKAAAENAEFLGSRAPQGGDNLPPLVPCRKEPQKVEPELTQKTLLDFCRELDAHITATYKNLAGRSVNASSLTTEKLLYASNGDTPVVYSHSVVPRTNISVSLTANDPNGSPVSLGKAFGGYGFFHELFSSPEALYQEVAILFEKVMKKREGVHPNAGRRQVVIGSEVAGILAHEAIGHTVEADLVLGGSVARNYMNQLVASELVTLVDFAHTVQGKPTPVPVIVDDEGVLAEDVVIIENGVLKRYMHNRASAHRMGYQAQGNARGNIFSDEPLIRMRNTAILPGTSRLEDIIASVDDGYYLVRSSNGQADTTSEFMFGIAEGYEIKNGVLGRAIRDTTISGVAFDMLKTVDMISQDMTWGSGGWCGKKQTINVGMGGPALRCYVNIGGR